MFWPRQPYELLHVAFSDVTDRLPSLVTVLDRRYPCSYAWGTLSRFVSSDTGEMTACRIPAACRIIRPRSNAAWAAEPASFSSAVVQNYLREHRDRRWPRSRSPTG